MIAPPLALLPLNDINESISIIHQKYQEFRNNLIEQALTLQLAPRFQYPPIIIAGPTASGKSSLALRLASYCNGVIINADSMQIYKEIPILSAQPSLLEQQEIPHSLYGYISFFQTQRFSVADWLMHVMQELEVAQHDQRIPILVGGTGMYISALLYGLCETPPVEDSIIAELEARLQRDGIHSLHEELALVDKTASERIHNQDKQRILRALGLFYSSGQRLSTKHQWKTLEQDLGQRDAAIIDFKSGIGRGNAFTLYLRQERQQLYNNIDERVIKMTECGLFEEIEHLYRDSHFFLNNKQQPKAIGIAEIGDFMQQKITKKEAIALMQQKTRNFAKRQETWFKNQFQFDLMLTNI